MLGHHDGHVVLAADSSYRQPDTGGSRYLLLVAAVPGARSQAALLHELFTATLSLRSKLATAARLLMINCKTSDSDTSPCPTQQALRAQALSHTASLLTAFQGFPKFACLSCAKLAA